MLRLTAIKLGLALVTFSALALTARAQAPQSVNPPEGFKMPPIHPKGVRLETQELAPGVYALLSGRPMVDNAGFVVGERGVLVIDANINGTMARQIQDAVRKITPKPILYLVNTNYHGDHTFGNFAFPKETLIVAHRETAKRMHNFEHEKQFLLPTVDNDTTVYGDVQLRLPDIVFHDHLKLDLGGRVVELYHFGRGNTPGDTVVYVPEAKVAWTGNLVAGEGTIPFLVEGDAGAYLQTVARFARTLDVKKIIPGHGLITSGMIFSRYLSYLSDLIHRVQQAYRSGWTLEETLARTSLGERYRLPPDSPIASLMAGFHRWNVQKTYLELNGGASGRRVGAS